ncbi:MAG TPA: hypothetical protein VGR22_11095, partial [Thermomicrobiales bacterium]|nr:hypothetical protein [Thermomicrobiales bacterium]
SGFGCDTTQGPHRDVEYVVARLPMPSVEPEDPMGWLNWRGRWGERQAWEFDGPVGPRRTRRWTDPVGWHEQLRDSSIAVPGARVFGPAPADVFCSATRYGSIVLIRLMGAPWYFLAMLLAPVIAVGGLLWLAWSTFVSTLRLYLRYLPAFAVLGLPIIPIGIVANAVYDLAIRYSAIRTLVELMEFTPVSYYVAALPFGSIQQLASLLIVVPAVMEIYRSIERGEPITPRTILRGMHAHFRPMLQALPKPLGKVVLAQLTVIGLPWAIERAVRWSFVAPAVLLDDTPPHQAPARSAIAVKGRWWRTAATLLVVTVLGTVPGPLLGIVLLVTESRAIDEINAWSSAIYAVTLPFAILSTAVLYRQDLGQQLPQSAQIPLGEHVPGGKRSLGVLLDESGQPE